MKENTMMMLSQLALVNHERIKTSAKQEPKSQSTVQWLKETKVAADVTTVDGGLVSDTETNRLTRDVSVGVSTPAPGEGIAACDKGVCEASVQLATSGHRVHQEKPGASLKHVKKLRKRIDVLEREVQAVTSVNRDLRQQLQAMARKEQEATRAASQFAQDLSAATQKHEATQQRLKTVSGKEQQLRRVSLELNDKIQGLESENKGLVEQVALLTAEVESLNEKLRELSQRDSVACNQNNIAVDEEATCEEFADAEQALDSGVVMLHEDTPSDTHVMNEALGFLDEEDGVWVFRPAEDTQSFEKLPGELVAGFETGDTVKRILWSNGQVELVPLQYRMRPRTISIRSFPRKRGVRRVHPSVTTGGTSTGLHTANQGDIVIVGGDCPTRYTEALSHLGPNISWHDGFSKKEKLEQMLRRAAVVVTIETQVSHWAMWLIRRLAKDNHFVWRQVKVKSVSSVKSAVMGAMDAVGAGM